MTTDDQPSAGGAFAKGGCGCFLAFVAIGFLVVVAGGNVRIDLGGAILLFVVGGVIGVITLAIYNKGRADADDSK